MATDTASRSDTSPAHALEQTLARRMHVLAALLVLVGSLPYLALLLTGPARPGSAGVLAMAAFGVGASLASLAWVRRSRRYLAAILWLTWPVFIGMSVLMVAQGGATGTAVWWLPLGPLIALQAGATRGGLAMAVLLVIELGVVQWLRQTGGLPATTVQPLGETQRLLAVTISVGCMVTVVALGVQWRRRLLSELDGAYIAARSAGEVRSRFIANMSHEIRTPLNGIVGAGELLRSSALDAGQRRSVEVLRYSAEALMALVNDVLDFSRLEAGRVEVEPVAFALADLLHDAAELFAAQADSKGLALSVRVAPGLPPQIVADPARLRQILHNLLANAVKFTESGEVQLTATRGGNEGGQPWLLIAVRDTGIGLSAAQRGRLFQAFEQADVSTTRRFGGSGLGLAISRELAALHGGSIEVESEPGKGSTFTLRLPMRLPAIVALPPPSAVPASAAARPLHGRTVLLVSPAAGLRESLAETLAGAGAAVEATPALPTPLELAAARDRGVAVVLADIRALDASGLDAGAWAAQLATAGLPGVLLVGMASRPGPLPASLHPVLKPARPALLLDALRAALAPAPAVAARPVTEPPRTGVAPPAVAASARRILLVEDHAINQVVARAMLESLGLQTVVAADGFEAIREFTAVPDGSFALVLMDCHMPRLDGLDCTRRLREIERQEHRRRTPIIAMTADSEAEAGARCLAAGMDGFLAKPVRREQLQQLIDRWAPSSNPP